MKEMDKVVLFAPVLSAPALGYHLGFGVSGSTVEEYDVTSWMREVTSRRCESDGTRQCEMLRALEAHAVNEWQSTNQTAASSVKAGGP